MKAEIRPIAGGERVSLSRDFCGGMMDSAWSKVFSGELLLSLIAQLKNFIEIGLAAWVMGMLRRIPKLIPRTKQDWWDWWREGTQSAIPGGEEKQQEQPKEEK